MKPPLVRSQRRFRFGVWPDVGSILRECRPDPGAAGALRRGATAGRRLEAAEPKGWTAQGHAKFLFPPQPCSPVFFRVQGWLIMREIAPRLEGLEEYETRRYDAWAISKALLG